MKDIDEKIMAVKRRLEELEEERKLTMPDDPVFRDDDVIIQRLVNLKETFLRNIAYTKKRGYHDDDTPSYVYESAVAMLFEGSSWWDWVKKWESL